ncbi:MAG: hypothetical protein ABFS86_19445 [Planctomycetota bacterium]
MAFDVEKVMAKSRDGVLILRPGIRTWVYALLICAVFVVASVSLLCAGKTGPVPWLGIVFFGSGIPIAGAHFVPGFLHLRLDTTGFTIRGLWRRVSVPWVDVNEFRVSSAGHAVVGWNLIPEVARKGVLASLNRGFAGVEACLPDTYGMEPEDLALLMESWRAVCTGSAPPADEEGQAEPDQPQR